jgi:DNA helicase-2/ATP-dependent DNA helicase PcrA
MLKKINAIFGSNSLVSKTLYELISLEQQPLNAIKTATKVLKKYFKNRYGDKTYKSIMDDIKFIEKVANRYSNTKSFLQGYILDAAYKNEDKEDKCIKIITVHSAKGTEAKYCILLQANNGVYPHNRAKHNIQSVEEERRILYVAMTRAKDELIITRTKTANIGREDDGCEEYFLGDLEGEDK